MSDNEFILRVDKENTLSLILCFKQTSKNGQFLLRFISPPPFFFPEDVSFDVTH